MARLTITWDFQEEGLSNLHPVNQSSYSGITNRRPSAAVHCQPARLIPIRDKLRGEASVGKSKPDMLLKHKNTETYLQVVSQTHNQNNVYLDADFFLGWSELDTLWKWGALEYSCDKLIQCSERIQYHRDYRLLIIVLPTYYFTVV